MADEWLRQHRAIMTQALAAACPDCGARNVKHNSHPATGVIFTCECGARSEARAWAEGRVELRRNKRGSYDYVP